MNNCKNSKNDVKNLFQINASVSHFVKLRLNNDILKKYIDRQIV